VPPFWRGLGLVCYEMVQRNLYSPGPFAGGAGLREDNFESLKPGASGGVAPLSNPDADLVVSGRDRTFRLDVFGKLGCQLVYLSERRRQMGKGQLVRPDRREGPVLRNA